MEGTGIIYMDDMENVSNVLFHSPSNSVQQYLNSGFNEYLNISNSSINPFIDAVKRKYEAVNDTAAKHYIDLVKHRLNGAWQPDAIRYLETIKYIQMASSEMQKYIMAYPPLRSRHLNGMVFGYEEEYVNESDGIGDTHYEYRRTVDGMLVHNAETNTSSYVQYIEAEEPVTKINVLDQIAILRTWDIISAHLDSGDNADPTSPWNGTM